MLASSNDTLMKNLALAYPNDTTFDTLEKLTDKVAGRLEVINRNDTTKLVGIITKKTRMRLLKKHSAKSKEADMLMGDIDVLEAELKHFQSALERFRAKPVQPTPSQNASSSQAS